MSRLRNLIIFIVLLVLLFVYCWILKNKPVKPEPSSFRESNMLPDLTFSKLADLENRMVIELDEASMEEFEKIRTPSFQVPEPIRDYDMMQVIVFISCSIIGIIGVLCFARRYYQKDGSDFYQEHFSSTNVLSSQEKLFKSYETTQN